MSTKKHTPGPWTYKATASRGPQYAVYSEVEQSRADIAIVYDHGQAEANAALIAAAPALLAAAELVIEQGGAQFNTPDDPILTIQLTRDEFNQLRAAIAMAKGEASK